MDRELFLGALQIGLKDTYVSGKWFFIRLLLAALAAAVHELRCSRAIYGLNRIVNIGSGKRLNYLFPIRSIKLLISRDIVGNITHQVASRHEQGHCGESLWIVEIPFVEPAAKTMQCDEIFRCCVG